MKDLRLDQAKGMGYCITSRSGRIASRLDRKDWEDIGCSADLYRRCYSKDNIIVPASWLKKLKNSSFGYNKYKEI